MPIAFPNTRPHYKNRYKKKENKIFLNDGTTHNTMEKWEKWKIALKATSCIMISYQLSAMRRIESYSIHCKVHDFA